MIIEPIGSASVALYLTPADLARRGLSPAPGSLTLEQALDLTREACGQAGIVLDGAVEIEAYPECCGVLVFARVRSGGPCWFVFDGLEPLLEAALDLHSVPVDGSLWWWEGRYWLSLPPGAEIKSESAVNDYAAVYTGEQIAAFEQKMQAMREEYDCNVVAFLINSDEWSASAPSAPELVSERYLDLDAHKSTVVLWLNICPRNRTLDVLGYGTAERKIDDSDADELAIKLQDYVKRQQSGSPGDFSLYVEMMDTFLSETDAEMRKPFFYLTWQFHLLLGAVAGLIVILVLLRNVGGKMTTNGRTCMDQ